MEFLDVAVQTIVISATGVFSPGPLTAISASRGLVQGWKAGFLCALGHMIIELPLSFLIALGLLETISNQNVRAFIGMTGGFVLIYLGANQIRKKDRISREDLPSVRTSFVAGALASGLNPYFIIWWLTVGAKLLSQSLLWMGWFGFLIVYILHVWMDYVWLIFVAHAFRMGKTLSERKYELLNGVLNSTVILLGIWFVFDAITLLKFS